MLDLFTIFTKGGIVLWYFQGTALSLTPAVNSLVKTVLLQERGGMDVFNHESLKLQFKLDNEFELIFVVVYQKILQLAYLDKLMEQVQLAFRDKYKNRLTNSTPLNPSMYSEFGDVFKNILFSLEEADRQSRQKPREMKHWNGTKKKENVTKPFNGKPQEEEEEEIGEEINGIEDVQEETGGREEGENGIDATSSLSSSSGSLPNSDKIRKIIASKTKKSSSTKTTSKKTVKPSNGKPKTKEARQWMVGGSKGDTKALDYSGGAPPTTNGVNHDEEKDLSLKGSMIGQLQPVDQDTPKESGGGGVFSLFKSITAGRVITAESIGPVMEKMKEHLITKNVAIEIADKLCSSVTGKLDGKTIGTFSGIQSVVKSSVEEALVQILSPKVRIDVLQDALKAKEAGRPFVVTFCGVNGVGKSTNLAKICFWLLENGLRVLIAACDTFRSGAVEQLKTHTCRLSSLHPPEREGGPPRVLLFERGYGKDAASICMEAVNFARQQRYDVVLVDTAGRMQDNEPLMVSLAKLIRVNSPDLVLFVGEALVGNEAVDQLVKFNRALIDFADSSDQNPRSIDGIVLTKFDTIDDKVGAAISMTYTTGQPIVFVGTGQTYQDLRTLNVQAVVAALLK
ncbi:PREDICTED: signal recognition particle receptor subunit alpha-like [Amphimedon queenslandica]|uniref:SRP54-type proteins GTP-binding domain-containing protein n=1 Tax=Amphimedon queenslandica TaxID=400682 RepID=A0A1X7UYY5_AMPQE|nr:PREDICTED: signal recognition particle receptor subunit alpha-like [Amphimedon queenslandica]|eukprot:XP_011403720.1 PREDICTED: signal recognition particle receptor subunit alpha-like [Amphimedon queenslandica]